MNNYLIDMGLAILFAVIKGAKIPAGYVKGLLKLRDALNAAFPPEDRQPAAHIQIV